MRRLALAAIRGYQRWLSPLKGFSCAFRVWSGAESCSAYGYRVIERFGLRRGLGLLDRRLALCGHVHRRMHAASTPVPHPLRRKQRGYCDVPCDCNGPDCDLNGCACSVCDCDPCDGYRKVRDWWRRNRNDQMDGHGAHLDAAAARVREQQARKRREAQQN